MLHLSELYPINYTERTMASWTPQKKYTFACHPVEDQDIIDHLAFQPQMQVSKEIRRLIRQGLEHDAMFTPLVNGAELTWSDAEGVINIESSLPDIPLPPVDRVNEGDVMVTDGRGKRWVASFASLMDGDKPDWKPLDEEDADGG
jgi:hypothetical protein